MKNFNGTLTPERPTTPWVREEKSDCTDCLECRCTEEDYCHECGEPLCVECACIYDDIPMCSECSLVHVVERRKRVAYRYMIEQRHDALRQMVEEVA